MGLKYSRYTPMALQYIVEQQATITASAGTVISAILGSRCYIGMNAVHPLRISGEEGKSKSSAKDSAPLHGRTTLNRCRCLAPDVGFDLPLLSTYHQYLYGIVHSK